MRVISLGWGVQSFGLAAMSALGKLPPLDFALFSDTGHERRETYEFAEKWTPWLEERGVQVVTVKAGKKTTSIEEGCTPPYFTLGEKGAGMLHRTCTDRWKIRPMRKWINSQIERGDTFEKWLGITLDEVLRMRQGKGREVLIYPFIEMLDRPWTRGMVMRWLQENNLEIPVKSSCVFCPYHDRATWREIQLSGNGDWQKALEVDRVIRDKRPGYKCYLTAQRKPLDECDFRSQEDHGQLTLWDVEECSGMCFL